VLEKVRLVDALAQYDDVWRFGAESVYESIEVGFGVEQLGLPTEG
jgi:hypothetical protein